MWETFTEFRVLSCVRLARSITENRLVEMRNTCQVTNQSSHGELSFHHNPHLQLVLGLGPFYFSRCSERGLKIEKCSSPYVLSLL